MNTRDPQTGRFTFTKPREVATEPIPSVPAAFPVRYFQEKQSGILINDKSGSWRVTADTHEISREEWEIAVALIADTRDSYKNCSVDESGTFALGEITSASLRNGGFQDLLLSPSASAMATIHTEAAATRKADIVFAILIGLAALGAFLFVMFFAGQGG